MDKQELIEYFKDLPYVSVSRMGKKSFIDMIEQLDEPQKVTVPQFVADYIKDAKEMELDLLEAMKEVGYGDINEVRKWFYKDKNMGIFARAWLDGYTVEEEKRYYVRFKFIEDSYSYLTLIKHLNTWTLTEIKIDKKFRTEHTKKQLEQAGFGWVFDCPGIEIEEVE